MDFFKWFNQNIATTLEKLQLLLHNCNKLTVIEHLTGRQFHRQFNLAKINRSKRKQKLGEPKSTVWDITKKKATDRFSKRCHGGQEKHFRSSDKTLIYVLIILSVFDAQKNSYYLNLFFLLPFPLYFCLPLVVDWSIDNIISFYVSGPAPASWRV